MSHWRYWVHELKFILRQSIFVQIWWSNTKQLSINKQWSENYCDLFLHDKLSRKQTSSEMNWGKLNLSLHYIILFVACKKQIGGMKNEMETNNRQKFDLNKQRLIQKFDLIYAGFIPFLCDVILYRIIEIFTTACKIDPH